MRCRFSQVGIDRGMSGLHLQAASGHMPADGSANELCVTTGVLSSVAGSPHAAHKLLNAYSGRLRGAQQRLLKPQNAGEWHSVSMHSVSELQGAAKQVKVSIQFQS